LYTNEIQITYLKLPAVIFLMIRKVGNLYVIYSEHKRKGKRRRLGSYKTLKEAKARLRQIEYFKRLKR